MKIYAARLSNADSDVFLDSQIGKDTWIKVRTKSTDYTANGFTDSTYMNDPDYVRLVSKQDNGQYVGARIDAALVENYDEELFYDMVYGGVWAYEELPADQIVSALLNNTETLPLLIFPIYPLELRTTAEMQEALKGYSELELSYDFFHEDDEE